MGDFKIVFLDGGPLPAEFREARARSFIPAVKRMLAMEERERKEKVAQKGGDNSRVGIDVLPKGDRVQNP